MKKVLFVLIALTATIVVANASTVAITLRNGFTHEGKLISFNDSIIVYESTSLNGTQEISVTADQVRYFRISDIGRYDVVNGKFVPNASTIANIEKQKQKQASHEQYINELSESPHLVIANAFQSTGTVAMGLGVPVMVIGAALTAYGFTGGAQTKKRADCATAGCVLLPMGAALTIVGIPLYIHGQRIAELKINYTGNGAGISMVF